MVGDNEMLLLTILLVVSVVFVFYFNVFWPFGIESVLYKGLTILANISYSYIVSFLFYFIVWIPERRSKKTIDKYVLTKTKEIGNEISHMINEMLTSSNLKEITEKSIRDMCERINPHEKAPLINGTQIVNGELKFIYANWAMYVVYYKGRIVNNIEELKKYSYSTDSTLFDIITRMQDSLFMKVVDGFLGNIHNVGNKDLSPMADQFIEIWNLNSELTSYNNKLEKRIAGRLFRT